MKVADVMSSPACTCSAEDPLARAAQIMWERDCGAVPVVDKQGRAIAVVTDRDICMAAFTQGRLVSELRVDQAMSKLVYTCHPEDRLSTAERTMRVHQVRRLPVVDDAGRLLGVLSINDVCRARVDSAASHFVGDVVVTLAEIGKARSATQTPSHQALQPMQHSDSRERDATRAGPRTLPEISGDPSSLFRL